MCGNIEEHPEICQNIQYLKREPNPRPQEYKVSVTVNKKFGFLCHSVISDASVAPLIMGSYEIRVFHEQFYEKLYKTEFLPLNCHSLPFFGFGTFLQPTYFASAQCRIPLPQDSVIHPALSDMELHVKKPSGVNNPFRIFKEQTKVWIMPFPTTSPTPSTLLELS